MNETQKYLGNLGIQSLNPMQLKALEIIEKGGEVVLLSPTGSGKTVAYLLPVIKMLNSQSSDIQVLILVPSRELALQIEQVFKQMGSPFKINCCYGGHSIKTEINNFSNPPSLLIGTPGRIADHVRRGNFQAETIKILVLDEFDKALELGFSEEMRFIIGHLKKIKKKILTSATPMDKIPDFAGVSNPVVLNYLDQEISENLTLKALRSSGTDKLETLFQLLCYVNNEPSLVFCNHRDAVDRISMLLKNRNIHHDIFHGGLEQDDRERALIKFRNGSHQVLITTDLASRGLDIPEIKNIIHYQLPVIQDSFTHRNGRTARMFAQGTAWLMVAENEYVPAFLTESPEFVEIPEQLEIPSPPLWVSLYFGGGKKEKISKTDIVGFLVHKGKLNKDEIGRIEVLDHTAYAAINRIKGKETEKLLRNEKIKNQKIKIALSW